MKFIKKKRKKVPVVKFRGKKYGFSKISLILFPVGSILLALPLLQFFEKTEIVWLHELFAKYDVFFLNLFFDLGVRTEYLNNTWYVTLSEYKTVYINNGCVGLPAMSIFLAVILFTPHSKDPKTNKNIILRKALDIAVSLILIYFANIFRAVIQFNLFSHGFPWSLVHDSSGTLAIMVIIHISIFLFCLKYLPEWYVSIFYSIKLIYKKLNKERMVESFNNIKQREQAGERDQYYWLQKLYKKEKLNLALIKSYKIDSRVIQFLKENKQKYTAKAIKNRVFSQQESITEDLLEKMLHIFLNANLVLSKTFNKKNYYFI